DHDLQRCGCGTLSSIRCKGVSGGLCIVQCRRPCTCYSVVGSCWQWSQCSTRADRCYRIKCRHHIYIHQDLQRCGCGALSSIRCKGGSGGLCIVQCRRPCTCYSVGGSCWQCSQCSTRADRCYRITSRHPTDLHHDLQRCGCGALSSIRCKGISGGLC